MQANKQLAISVAVVVWTYFDNGILFKYLFPVFPRILAFLYLLTLPVIPGSFQVAFI